MTAGAPLRVVVVDDDRDTTECMRLLIGQWGHHVCVANEAGAAVQQAQSLKPDVMLVDLSMPVVDGLTVARQIRGLPDLVGMSLVALTGHADPSHRQQAIDAGFDEFLVKPLPADALKALLDRIGARIAATKDRSALAVEAAAISNDQIGKVRRGSPEPVDPLMIDHEIAAEGEIISIRLERSGISDLVLLENDRVAERLRNWLREASCRVGPVFQPSPGRVAFYSYSRRRVRTLLAAHPAIRVEQ